uniref:Uncharacterized protein n=1 Tax=Seriola lalandi dorsalis TaxID=1841481 RepID=A0A3B4XEM8_SERLL
MQDSVIHVFTKVFMCKRLCTLAFVYWFMPVSVRACVCVYLCICVCPHVLSVYLTACVCVCLSFSASPIGQLECDSPIRASPVVQSLSAVVSDTELSLLCDLNILTPAATLKSDCSG